MHFQAARKVSNGVNNFNTNMKRIWHIKKINVIGLKELYSFIFKI